MPLTGHTMSPNTSASTPTSAVSPDSGSPSVQVPDPHRAVHVGADDHRSAVPLPNHDITNPGGVAGQRLAHRLTGGRVPDPHRVVKGVAGDDHESAYPLPQAQGH